MLLTTGPAAAGVRRAWSRREARRRTAWHRWRCSGAGRQPAAQSAPRIRAERADSTTREGGAGARRRASRTGRACRCPLFSATGRQRGAKLSIPARLLEVVTVPIYILSSSTTPFLPLYTTLLVHSLRFFYTPLSIQGVTLGRPPSPRLLALRSVLFFFRTKVHHRPVRDLWRSSYDAQGHAHIESRLVLDGHDGKWWRLQAPLSSVHRMALVPSRLCGVVFHLS